MDFLFQIRSSVIVEIPHGLATTKHANAHHRRGRRQREVYCRDDRGKNEL